MKTPRDLKGIQLIKLLHIHFSYEHTRQVGSHIRLTTQEMGTHHLTVPNHNPVRIGTLNTILSQIADHFQISREEVARRLFES